MVIALQYGLVHRAQTTPQSFHLAGGAGACKLSLVYVTWRCNLPQPDNRFAKPSTGTCTSLSQSHSGDQDKSFILSKQRAHCEQHFGAPFASRLVVPVFLIDLGCQASAWRHDIRFGTECHLKACGFAGIA